MLATDIRKDHKAHMKLFGNRLHCTTTILIQIAQTKIPVIYSHTYLTLVWMEVRQAQDQSVFNLWRNQNLSLTGDYLHHYCPTAPVPALNLLFYCQLCCQLKLHK